MAFSYTINAGKILYGADATNKSYLQNTFGFSDDALAGLERTPATLSTATLSNPGKLVSEYSSIFNSTLAVSDGYKFFENENTNHMDSLLTTNNLSYTSDKAISRIDAYTELFLEKFKSSADSTSITITSGGLDFDGYSFNHYDSTGKIILSTTTISASNPITGLNQVKLKDLAAKLEQEALLLKSELQTNELAYGGYPAIGYTAADAKVKLLQQQLDAATQQFVKCYDQLFAQYKIDAGGHQGDDGYSDPNGEALTREKEAGTAATMAAMLAMNYAETYYAQDIKPNVADYVFGQAPVIFKSDATNSGLSASGERDLITATLEKYGTGSNLDSIFAKSNASDAYFVKNTATNPAVTATASDYRNIFWDMNTGMNSNGTISTGYTSGDLPGGGTALINGVASTDAMLDEICGTNSAMTGYINWIVRDSFAVGGLTTTVRNTDYCSETTDFTATEIFAAAQKLVDLKMKLEKASIESAINNQVLAEYEARVGALTALKAQNYCLGTDPYTVNIDGQDYMLGQDSNADGNISDMQEILGINDTQSNIFESMKKLDTNNDGYVSQEEMQAQKIVLSAVKDGKISNAGYDMSLVKGINLASLQNADGTNNVFGTFTMDLQDKQVNGKLTFEDGSYFTNLFGKDISEEDIADESSIAPIAIPTSNTASKTSTVATETTTDETTTTPEETASTASKIDTSNFAFSFNDAEDNKSTIEKLFEQICWKLGISNVSSSQKYSIIDGIDPNADAAIAEAAIQEDLEKFNLSA